jgi:ubiquinol-cytochrome c reductase cytochrome b subunit
MKKALYTILLTLPVLAFSASESDWPMADFEPNLENLPSLQKGFTLYVNYCLGCHSLQYQRYERTADDLGIPHEIALENLVLSDQKIGELMTSAMTPEQAKKWFGAPPPDLTMVARVRDAQWIYNYLKTFYVDESRPFGVNNKVFENVGMPNVLAHLQGVQRDACPPPVSSPDGEEAQDCYELVVDEGSGAYARDEFDVAIYDLTNFLYYVAEPSRLERHRIGIGVLLFLIVLGCFTYLLNREYWKDIPNH